MCLFSFFFYIGFLFSASTPFFMLNYTAQEYAAEYNVLFNMNFQGIFYNFTPNEGSIPDFFNKNYVLTFAMNYSYYLTYLVCYLSWIFIATPFVTKKKTKVTLILLSMVIYVIFYITMVFYNSLNLENMVNAANIEYEKLRILNSNIDRSLSYSLAPNWYIFLLIPPIFLILFNSLNFIPYNYLIEEYGYIIYNEVFFQNLLEIVIYEKHEEDLWDVKENLEMWNKKIQPSIREDKQIEFCEKVSSFANYRGGIIIIGVSDVLPREVIGLNKIEKKIIDLEDKLKKRIVFNQKFYKIKEILLKNRENERKRCILVLIYQTKNPIAVKQKNNDISYKKREGPGCISTNPNDLFYDKKSVLIINLKFIKELIKGYDLRY